MIDGSNYAFRIINKYNTRGYCVNMDQFNVLQEMVDMQKKFIHIKESLKELLNKEQISIEDILNYVRQIREITCELASRSYDSLTGEDAKNLDTAICKHIYDSINEKEKSSDITELRKFFAWLDMTSKKCTNEIFTTNYDLLLEKSMESNYIQT